MTGNQSELAQTMRRIEEECQAINLLMHSFACTAPHFVTKMRYKALDNYRSQLASVVGEEQATTIVIEKYNEIVH